MIDKYDDNKFGVSKKCAPYQYDFDSSKLMVTLDKKGLSFSYLKAEII